MCSETGGKCVLLLTIRQNHVSRFCVLAYLIIIIHSHHSNCVKIGCTTSMSHNGGPIHELTNYRIELFTCWHIPVYGMQVLGRIPVWGLGPGRRCRCANASASPGTGNPRRGLFPTGPDGHFPDFRIPRVSGICEHNSDPSARPPRTPLPALPTPGPPRAQGTPHFDRSAVPIY